MHPAIQGVPWWAAILIAVVATLAGCAIDAGVGNRELTAFFATFYVVGCIAAVLAVRHTGIFTAVVQPPLILFVTVPSAYYLLHSAEIAGAKDVVINCFYPLIERFLLMFLTSLAVLLIGAARWYLESARHQRAAGTGATAAAPGDLLAGLRSRIRGLFGADEPEPGTAGREPRTHLTNRAAAARPPRERQSPGQAATRSRHARPPMDDPDAAMPPPRRRRPRPRDFDGAGDAAMPPQRRRAPRDPESRGEPWARESWPPRQRASEYPDRPRRPAGGHGVDPDDPPAPRGGAPSSHLPFSNVRYRGDDDGQDAGYRRPPR